jgi:hypothetical protein
VPDLPSGDLPAASGRARPPEARGMRTQLINIDSPPEVVFESLARVLRADNGRPYLMPMESSRWNAHLSRLVDKGTVRVSVARQKGERSDPQNRYLWAVVYEDYYNGLKARAADVGVDCPIKSKKHLHKHLKQKYIKAPESHFDDGEEILAEPTTTSLDIDQCASYITAIMAEAAQRGIYIRPANKEWRCEE